MANIRKTFRRILSAGFCLALLVSLSQAVEESYAGSFARARETEADGPRGEEFGDSLKALREGDSYERHRAAIALGRSGNTEAVEPLIKALNDEDLFVRSFSAVALGNLGDRRAVAPLIKAMGDESLIVRSSAATALGSLRDPSAVDSLAKALKDENYLVRRAAAEALGSLGDPRGVDPLIEALRDEDSYLWNGASIALTQIGSAGIPRLVNALGEWVTGPRAADVLKSLGWQPASDEERVRYDVATRNAKALVQNWEMARKVLISEANQGNDRQAENAVCALIGAGQEETLDGLAGILRKRGSKELATIFLKSGNTRLAGIAEAWAKEQGIEINAGDNPGPVTWGGMKSF
jgi:HEAT repeat protein